MARDTGGAATTDPMRSTETESTDQILRALADGGRRAAMAYLVDVDRAVSRDELVEHVAVETTDQGILEGGEFERLAIRFHHHHLPELDAAGLVDYDHEQGVVQPTPLADRVDPWTDRR